MLDGNGMFGAVRTQSVSVWLKSASTVRPQPLRQATEDQPRDCVFPARFDVAM